MSEYQFVAFRAIDRPLNDEQFKFAQSQSSRAEVSRWWLTAEYQYSSFRGNPDALLRHGFDVYLQYTNYGDREIKLRLPHGIPFHRDIWSKYVDGKQLQWSEDAKGHGGILTLSPFHESGELDDIWEFQEFVDAVIQVREQLLTGDLRALYLLWLCAAADAYNDPAEMIELPVPHGIAESASYGGDVLVFFGLDPLVLAAAGSGLPPAPQVTSEESPVAKWVQGLENERARELLHLLLTGDTVSEKARLLAEIRDSQNSDGWPTSDKQRSLEELLRETTVLREEEDAREARAAEEEAERVAAEAERRRLDRMKEMVRAPDKWLRETEQLVARGGTANYKVAAEILDDLREAVGGDEGNKLARSQATRLVKKNPTLNHLKSSLRKRGLLA